MSEMIAAVVGLFTGGLLNVLVDRLPPHEHVEGAGQLGGKPRQLEWWEYLPLASTAGAMMLRRSPVENNRLRYLAVDLITASLFFLAWHRFGEEPLVAVAVCVFSAAPVALAFIDLETQFLPDRLVLPLLVVALAFSPFWPGREWWQGIAGAGVGYAVFYPLAWIGDRLDRDIMGWGDVKLSAAMGAMLGIPFLLIGLYIGIIAGGFVGAIVYSARMFGFRRTLIPYGPYLVLGGIVALYYGRTIIDWFLGQA
ncbi:MAG: prepilin peptidase [Dehalococcoidia bacterium]